MTISIWLPYVYKVTHKATGQFYIGMRSANKQVAEKDLGIKYFTSNKLVKSNFDKFNIEILAYFIDQEAAFYFENSLIEEHFHDPLILNKHFQRTFGTFSSSDLKRLDLAEMNKVRLTKPKEERVYTCCICGKTETRLEFCHHPVNSEFVCGHSCNGKRNGTRCKGKKNPKLSEYRKGKPTRLGHKNPSAAENGKKGASKQSETVTGRKKKVLEDGSWIWIYPDKLAS